MKTNKTQNSMIFMKAVVEAGIEKYGIDTVRQNLIELGHHQWLRYVDLKIKNNK